MNVLDAAAARGGELALVTRGAKGPEWHGPCPGCGGRDRFHVWPEQNDGAGSYWCRQCGKRGDLIQFFRDFSGMSFGDACKAAGRERPECRGFVQDAGDRRGGFAPKPAAAPTGVDLAAWAAAADKFVARCAEAIQARPDVLAYLEGRGIGPDAVGRYRLGWHGGENGKPHAFRPRAAWGLPPEAKADGTEKKLWIPRGLVIPYAVNGQVVRVKIRRPEEDRRPGFDLPYHFIPGGSREMMVTRADRRACVVVEAELDAVAVDAAAGDLVGAVAVGTSRAKPEAGLHDRLLAAHKLLVALDADEAGRAAWPWWGETYPAAVYWPVPSGKDPGDAAKAGVDLRSWILAGLPPSVTGRALRRPAAKPAAPEAPVHAGERQPVAPRPERPPLDMPEGLTRMYGYLRKYPVQVYTGGGHMRILQAPAWQNWGELKEISRLIYGDEDVFLYLQCHPAETIHRGNFWDGVMQ